MNRAIIRAGGFPARGVRTRTILGCAVGAVACGVAATAHADPINTVFYIAMENHNWTQPGTVTSPQQIMGNSAAPFVNSLIDPNSPNAAQSSYATTYYNAGIGVHPSEPNYLWAEAGTNYNKDTNTTIATGLSPSPDGDPSAANKNIFSTTPHLTGLMNAAGVSWNNYQEDVDRSTAATVSASGTSGANNPYYGTNQYNYAVKHNPMAFFTDTATQNVKTFDQLRSDINANNFAKYNWITPNQYNDMHSSLSTDFTYNGTTYAHGTDQQAIAIGDNFLATIVPQIEATQAYKNNGAIVIWFDETEKGDTKQFTVPEIVLSPLAKGNAYASSVELNHSSDIKTMQEVFGLGPDYLNNPIPATETNASGVGYNTVSSVNDLSDLFQPGTIPTAVPEPASLGLLGTAGLALLVRRRRQA